jgi:hypothetical protein
MKRLPNRANFLAKLALIAATVLVATRSAPAAPSDREKARDKLAEGVRSLSSRDFAGALARFDEAYDVIGG